MKPNTNIVLGFDFGLKYIGVAVGQKISKTASPLTSIIAKNGTPNWDHLTTLINEWDPAVLIVGLPLNMDGSTQPITIAAQNFTQQLKLLYKLPVYLVDERLSSWEAKNKLQLRKQTLNKQELAKINALAAALITEQWLQEK